MRLPLLPSRLVPSTLVPNRLVPGELHLSDRPSVTAEFVTLTRALELARPPRERIVSDPYAPLFLGRRATAAHTALRTGKPLIRAAERYTGGVSAYVLCRHRFIDEQLLTALANGVEQVVILGAGYDTRAYRFADELDGRPVFEVDLAPLSRRKARIVAEHPDSFGSVTIRRVEIDFRAQALDEVLAQHGFLSDRSTFVAWEGVVPYLDEAAVATTMDALRSILGAGSVVALDMWDGIGGHGVLAPVRRLAAHSLALVGEPVSFGMVAGDFARFAAAHGFLVDDVAAGSELAMRYSTDGRRVQQSIYVLALTRD